MNITRRDPFEVPFVQMNRLFNQMLGDQAFREGGEMQEALLPLDVLEEEKSVIVKASLPGIKPEDIDVELHNGILTISAEQSQESEQSTGKFLRRERRWGAVSRSVALPSQVDEDAVQAELDQGVLTLRIPKSKDALPRKIRIGKGAAENAGQNGGKAR
jgi:HSP20 family protein